MDTKNNKNLKKNFNGIKVTYNLFQLFLKCYKL